MLDCKLQEECGVIGVFGDIGHDPATVLLYGMYGIQHRGQQSAGIAVNYSGKIIYHKELGLSSEVFNDIVLHSLKSADSGVGHVGYNKERDRARENTQPLVVRYRSGQMAISYNGCLLNSSQLRTEFEEQGAILQTTSDAEIIALLLSRERVKQNSLEDALVQVMKKIKGAYSFLLLTEKKMIAVRDPYGMKPLCMGRLNGGYVFASETASFDIMGAEFERDVYPGEVVVVSNDGIKSMHTKTNETTAMCIFEFVYLAKTDSYIDGINVYNARNEAGRQLAKECPADADMVVGVPDSAIPAALGYAAESGLPYGEAPIKNRYIGRTFIQPTQSLREKSVRLKLNALRSQIEGKRIVLIDDSIVRGTTSKQTVQMLRDVGKVKEIHMRISSPPVVYPCIYGIDTPDKSDLLANRMTPEEICRSLEIDSLGYLSMDGLLKTPKGAKCSFCSACFDGKYPIVDKEENADGLQASRG